MVAFDDAVGGETFFTHKEAVVSRLAAAIRTKSGVGYSWVADDAHRLVDGFDESMTRGEAHEYRHRFKRKTILAGATLLYAAYGYYEAEELDEVLDEAAEAATGLVADERAVIPPTAAIRGQDTCPNCGHDVK